MKKDNFCDLTNSPLKQHLEDAPIILDAVLKRLEHVANTEQSFIDQEKQTPLSNTAPVSQPSF